MLQGGVLSYDGSGRVRNTPTAPATAYVSGIPIKVVAGVKLLLTASAAMASMQGGTPYDSSGNVAFEAAAPAKWVNGIPLTTANRVSVVVNGAVNHYKAGLPFDVSGSLALATAE